MKAETSISVLTVIKDHFSVTTVLVIIKCLEHFSIFTLFYHLFQLCPVLFLWDWPIMNWLPPPECWLHSLPINSKDLL